MTPSDAAPPPEEPSAEAQRLFDEWADAREAGAPAPTAEEFCRQHPQHEHELRALVSEWQALQDFGGRLRAEFGAAEPAHPDALARQSEQLEALRRRQGEGRHYEPRGEVGRGGMGVVLRVHDRDIGRDLAMKVLRRREGSDASGRGGGDVTRFLQEAQITGQLDHPGVVAVHDLGVNPDGDVYFTMSLVQGRNLSEVFRLAWAEEEGWNQTRVVSVLLKVCETLAYAHSKLVVHRDLKPANVMVGRFGEVYVMDWGLARSDAPDPDDPSPRADESADIRTVRRSGRADESSSPWLTRAGSVLGTPAYMSPEQASGKVHEVGPRSDVYALGAMLYELLAGHPPYVTPGEQPSAERVLDRIRRGPPAPLDEVAQRAAPELVAIVDKAMAREPDQRYQGTLQMAQDLHAYLEHRVVGAYETGPLAELRKWVRRNRATAALLATTLFVSLGSLGLLWSMELHNSRDLKTERDKADAAARDLATANQELEDKNQALADARAEAEAKAASLSRVVKWLEDMFQAGRPQSTRDYNTSARDLLVAAASELWHGHMEDPLVATRLHYAVSSLFHNLGDEEQAERHALAARDAALEAYGPDAPTTLEIQNLLTSVWFQAGQTQRAAALMRELEEVYANLEDVPPATRAAWLSNRAAARVDDTTLEGGLEAAQRDLDEAIRLLEGLGDRKVHLLLTARANLAVLYERTGRFEETERLLQANLDLALRALGEDHPKTASIYTRMGEFLRVHSRFDEADEALGKAHEINLRLLGPGHRETLFSLRGRAALQAQLGRMGDAETTLRAAVEEAERSLSPRDALTRDMRNMLAGVLGSLGRLEESERLVRQDLDFLLEERGPDDPKLIDNYYQLGRLYVRQRKLDEAIAVFEKALALRRTTGNEWTVSRINLLNELGYCHLLKGDPEGAEPYLIEALDTCHEALGPHSQFTVRGTVQVANLRKLLGERGEAELLFDEALEVAREHLPERHPVRAMALYHFVVFLKEDGHYEEAAELAEELVEATDPADLDRTGYQRMVEDLRRMAAGGDGGDQGGDG